MTAPTRGVRLHWLYRARSLRHCRRREEAMQRLLLGEDRVVIIAGDAMLDMDLAPAAEYAHVQAHGARGDPGDRAGGRPIAAMVWWSPRLTAASGASRKNRRPAQRNQPPGQHRHLYVFEPEIFRHDPARRRFTTSRMQCLPGDSRPRPALLCRPVGRLLDRYRQPGRLSASESGLPRRIASAPTGCGNSASDDNLIADERAGGWRHALAVHHRRQRRAPERH